MSDILRVPITREALLKKRPRRTKVLDLPELQDGGPIPTVTIQAMTEGERSRYEMAFVTSKGEPRISSLEAARRKLIIETVIDSDGNKLLTPDDLDALAERDSAVLSRIYDESRKLSGFSETDIEELVKNSKAPPAGGSPTA